MKNVLYILIIIVLISCKEHNTSVILKKPCPLPYALKNIGTPVPIYNYISKLSPNGQRILFDNNFKILDLKTNRIQQIDFSSILPKNMYYKGIKYQAYWCPYDNNSFAMTCVTGTDTIGDGKSFIETYQLIIVNLDSNKCEVVTPKIFSGQGSSLGLGLFGWLPGSTKNNNKFFIGFISPSDSNYTFSEYDVNSQTIQKYKYDFLQSYTFNGNYYFYSTSDTNSNIQYNLNNVLVNFPNSAYTLFSKGDFSPSGKQLAVSVKVLNCAEDSARLDEIWIIDVDKYISNPINPVPIKIINLRDNFCMFTYQLNAVFTSETTLALAMFKDGDKYGNIYEIDINGNMVRQLTSVP